MNKTIIDCSTGQSQQAPLSQAEIDQAAQRATDAAAAAAAAATAKAADAQVYTDLKASTNPLLQRLGNLLEKRVGI